jgi:hypothetical protein
VFTKIHAHQNPGEDTEEEVSVGKECRMSERFMLFMSKVDDSWVDNKRTCDKTEGDHHFIGDLFVVVSHKRLY